MNGLFESKDAGKFWGWMQERPPTARWGVFAALFLFAFAAFVCGYSSGKLDGYHSGFLAGQNEACPAPNISEDSTPMNFSAFLDWAGEVELPPIEWAFLILLVLVILR